ncbi:hypothetical protein BGX28_003999 [Mortierella sp. GBA30]|nr:hypothetical protein BGX28_003999 [Mortierella sp. GBA30]
MGNQNSKRPSSKGNRNSAIVDPITPSHGSNKSLHSSSTNQQKQHHTSNSNKTNVASGVPGNGQGRTSKEANRNSWQHQQYNNNNNNNNYSNGPNRSLPAKEATFVATSQRDHSSKNSAQGAAKQESSSPSVPGTGPAGVTGAAKVSPSSSLAGELGSHRQSKEQSHSLDTIAQGTNGSHRYYSKSSSSMSNNNHMPPQTQTQHTQTQAQTQPQAQPPNNHDRVNGHSIPNDTYEKQQQHPPEHEQQREQQHPYPAPSIPFAVSSPGNPILVKKHNLAPLTITSSHSSSYPNRSPPPQLSPKSGHQKKSQELSPTARLSFLGPGSSDKNASYKSIDLDDMISRLLDAGYSGKISKSICLKNSEILHICQAARDVFLSQPTLIELNAPVKIVGDIHGQYTDLLRLFEMCGFPPSANFLFLGDYVDRGRMSLETILLLFCYKIKYPENFFLLRGNHECANVTKVYGFYDECKRRASIKMWKAFVDVFNCLPLAAIVANKIFCVHGGLSPSLSTMDDIRALRRPTDVPDYGLLNDLLWSDPSDTTLEWEDNERGVSYCFGRSIIQKFLNKHDFDLICRAHMVVEDGYEFFNDRTLVTVFSAPNYCGEFDNFGAVMSVNEDLLCSFELLKPIDQATARAQMQILAASSGGWRVNKQRLSIPDSNSLYGSSRSSVVN